MRRTIIGMALASALVVVLGMAVGASAHGPSVRGTSATARETVVDRSGGRLATASVTGTSLQATGPEDQAQDGPEDQAREGPDEQAQGGPEDQAEDERSDGQGDVESDTHEDPDGVDVQHECPPSCDTANGEQP